jgi:hypothetical protein
MRASWHALGWQEEARAPHLNDIDCRGGVRCSTFTRSVIVLHGCGWPATFSAEGGYGTGLPIAAYASRYRSVPDAALWLAIEVCTPRYRSLLLSFRWSRSVGRRIARGAAGNEPWLCADNSLRHSFIAFFSFRVGLASPNSAFRKPLRFGYFTSEKMLCNM